MRKKSVSPRELVDRLEQKYQKKVRFQKYKSFTKHLRQGLSQAQGMSVKNFRDDPFEMFGINDYEYIGR